MSSTPSTTPLRPNPSTTPLRPNPSVPQEVFDFGGLSGLPPGLPHKLDSMRESMPEWQRSRDGRPQRSRNASIRGSISEMPPSYPSRGSSSIGHTVPEAARGVSSLGHPHSLPDIHGGCGAGVIFVGAGVIFVGAVDPAQQRPNSLHSSGALTVRERENHLPDISGDCPTKQLRTAERCIHAGCFNLERRIHKSLQGSAGTRFMSY